MSPTLHGSLYTWYEHTEEPFWASFEEDYFLSSWMRDTQQHHPMQNWFVNAYPSLAPYHPYTSSVQLSTLVDPAEKFTGYWWP